MGGAPAAKNAEAKAAAKSPRTKQGSIPEWRLKSAKALRLRHHEDLRTLGIVAFTWFLFVMRWFTPSSSMPNLVRFLSWWTCAIFSWFCATIVHNCVHVPQFTESWLNKGWQVVLSLSYGYPVSTLIPGHNLSHHQFCQTTKDVIRTDQMRWQYNLFNLVFFIPTVTGSITEQDMQYMAMQRRKGRPIWFQAIREFSVLAAFNLALAYWDFAQWFEVILTSQLFAKIGIISINLPQHDGCPTPEESKYNFSRNFTGTWLNWFTCNNGYHTIHHMYPGMHWSTLKDEHDRLVKPYMHPSLDQPNLLWYLFVTYVLPGGRKKFDGTPYVLQPPINNIPWYTEDASAETYSDKSNM